MLKPRSKLERVAADSTRSRTDDFGIFRLYRVYLKQTRIVRCIDAGGFVYVLCAMDTATRGRVDSVLGREPVLFHRQTINLDTHKTCFIYLFFNNTFYIFQIFLQT